MLSKRSMKCCQRKSRSRNEWKKNGNCSQKNLRALVSSIVRLLKVNQIQIWALKSNRSFLKIKQQKENAKRRKEMKREKWKKKCFENLMKDSKSHWRITKWKSLQEGTLKCLFLIKSQNFKKKRKTGELRVLIGSMISKKRKKRSLQKK